MGHHGASARNEETKNDERRAGVPCGRKKSNECERVVGKKRGTRTKQKAETRSKNPREQLHGRHRDQRRLAEVCRRPRPYWAECRALEPSLRTAALRTRLVWARRKLERRVATGTRNSGNQEPPSSLPIGDPRTLITIASRVQDGSCCLNAERVLIPSVGEYCVKSADQTEALETH